MVMASLGQPLAQAVQPVQRVRSASFGKGRSSGAAPAGAEGAGAQGRFSRAQRR